MTNQINDMLNIISKNIDLGHKKRDASFLRQIKNMCENPGKTASGGSIDTSSIISAYRFARNPKNSLTGLRESRLKTTLGNIDDNETVLLINDVSLLDYCSHSSKKDRRSIGDGNGKGYEYICNLAVSLERELPLGVLHDCVISAEGPDDHEQVDYFDSPIVERLPEKSIEKLPCNHKHTITTHALHIASQAPSVKFISTADREFDDYFHFYALQQKGIDSVVRSCANRNVQMVRPEWLPESKLSRHQPGLKLLDEHVCVNMKRLIEYMPLKPLKTIYLDNKGRNTSKGLHVESVPISAGACSIVLYRQAKRDGLYVKPFDYVKLNLVVVKETCPKEGREPILWVLLTTLPVDSTKAIGKVVRIYELRWKIECFFKLLKSGFGLEELCLSDASKTAKHLTVITIAAAFISMLKSSLGLGASAELDEESYKKVKHASKNLNDNSIDINLRLFAFIAMQGKWMGYRKSGISPLMLMRGLAKVMNTLEMLTSFGPFLQEATKNGI